MFALAPLLASLAVAVAAPAGTDLRITVWPNGPDETARHTWRLRCGPPGGTLPGARTACRRLGAIDRPFAPVPKDVACAEIYGGPQVARVTGGFEGRSVWARFRRNDGCQIARWNRVRFLFPVRTGTR